MAVLIGSARISENGTIDGKPGDQYNGFEVSTQNWYKRTDGKNWVVLRCKEAKKRELIARCMELACKTNLIGYSQPTRLTLYNAVKPYGFDIEKLNKPVNTDCSGLVRVCCNYAGINVGNFTTYNEVSVLKATGEFEVYTDAAHCASENLLLRGDILVTDVKGHTAVVLSDGNGVEQKLDLGARTLRKGSIGTDVADLQKRLNALGYDCGTVDGDFGTKTEAAVKRMQSDRKIAVDGIFGVDSFFALVDLERVASEKLKCVRINGGTVHVRKEPTASSESLGIVKKGDTFQSDGETSPEGWHKIVYNGSPAWVSGMYSEII